MDLRPYYVPPPYPGKVLIQLQTRRAFLLSSLAPFMGEASVRPRKLQLCGIDFEALRNGKSSRRYLLIHGDEETARQTLRAHMAQNAGLAHLVTGKERIVTVAGGRLDPNRMFSRAGAGRSYRRLNPQWSAAQVNAALDWLDKRRPKMLKALLPPPGGLLIALHNNSRGYSVRSEMAASEQTSLPRLETEPHNFFLCTDAADFTRLSATGYNAVLQQGTRGEDDGSLSRLCAAGGIRYLNLEVEIGNLSRQQEMLRAAESLP